MAPSATYGVAASASRIIVSPSSIVGSIGVVMIQLDRSAEFERKRRRPTLIFAGTHMADGHPIMELPDAFAASAADNLVPAPFAVSQMRPLGGPFIGN